MIQWNKRNAPVLETSYFLSHDDLRPKVSLYIFEDPTLNGSYLTGILLMPMLFAQNCRLDGRFAIEILPDLKICDASKMVNQWIMGHEYTCTHKHLQHLVDRLAVYYVSKNLQQSQTKLQTIFHFPSFNDLRFGTVIIIIIITVRIIPPAEKKDSCRCCHITTRHPEIFRASGPRAPVTSAALAVPWVDDFCQKRLLKRNVT